MVLEADRALVHGVTFTSQLAPTEPPLITLVSKAKCGKSTAAISLFDWPNDGDRPLMVAFDRTGPDSCAQLGYAVPNVKIADLPGANIWEKSKNFLVNMEDVYISRRKRPYSSLVVDCGSTQANAYWTAAAAFTNKLQRYGAVLEQCTEFLDRVMELGIPVIYLSWLQEPWTEEKGNTKDGNKQTIPHKGGLSIKGSFRETLAGRSMMILLLEKTKPSPAVKERDADGFKRVFHTREYASVECGGRYKLPEPMDANMGTVLAMIMGMMPNPALEGLELKR